MTRVKEVFLKGNANTPQRFWEFALMTETKHSNFYNSIGFIYSQKHTEEYKNLSEDDKNKVKFSYINGVKQF